jgi:hypothetical protein
VQNTAMSFVDRLFEADKCWNEIYKTALEKRKAILQSWAAEYYTPMHSAQLTTPHTMNLIDRAVEIVVPYLVMSNPHAMIDALNPKRRAFAYTSELAINQWIRKFRLSFTTLYTAVRNSLFGMGIVRSGIMKSHQLQIMGSLHDVGEPFADVIDECDFIMDPAAKTFESAAFMGNYYYMPTEFAKEFFPSKFADKIQSSVQLYNYGSAEQLSKTGIESFDMQPKFLKPMTRLVDHWLPDEGVIITNLADGTDRRILREVPHEGPGSGPYDILAYKFYPETAIPIPPAWSWMDMDTLFNVIINKIKVQALGEKAVLAYESEAAEDAERIAEAGDRKTVKVDHIDSMKMQEFPGVNPESYRLLNYLQMQWSEQGGNLATLGGRSSEAPTLGQEQMLMSNASRSLDHMLNCVYNFTQSILEKTVYNIWTDPTVDIPVVKEVKNVGIITSDFNATTRQGEFSDYQISIKPMSMQRPSANTMYQNLIQLVTQWIIPTAQIAAQQGAQLDVPATTKKLARLAGIDDLDNIYQTAQTPMAASPNPYQPNPENKAVQDGRTGMQGAASRNQNLLQKSSKTSITPTNG